MNRTIPRLVRVFYEPPPFGPRTSLNRPTYGQDGGTTPLWLEKLNKMPSWQPIVAGCTLMLVGAYVPIVVLQKDLPFTLSPEYEAATRAYMRYHNMNPIWGISSKSARAAADH
mmetsp:Transcript_23389/g.48552  ORF Transcript_23389/g.48552 Transcript_23389/m.48552 type:complete len:113 (+) Transcript_23389:459-797(+)|eukprot:CAMPEP_0178510440 /NCGR_PEP_ID=MMETSP0696-20121128/21832_1 /TAXON_ID=265572 /ORGANISM="Extubocellulus spinifer, Strain CCMP396" /LENGTH=112 /DNA_ID=CAMNT_0020140151 /DNA_START=55 /DNA_END=393 /DNA_ORIENTATION=-